LGGGGGGVFGVGGGGVVFWWVGGGGSFFFDFTKRPFFFTELEPFPDFSPGNLLVSAGGEILSTKGWRFVVPPGTRKYPFFSLCLFLDSQPPLLSDARSCLLKVLSTEGLLPMPRFAFGPFNFAVVSLCTSRGTRLFFSFPAGYFWRVLFPRKAGSIFPSDRNPRPLFFPLTGMAVLISPINHREDSLFFVQWAGPPLP